MQNYSVVVNVSLFNGKNAFNKHGEQAIILRPAAGVIPNNARVIDGTVAQGEGFEPNKNYLVQVSEQGIDDEYGMQYSIQNFGELTPIQLLSSEVKALGTGRIAGVTDEDEADEQLDAAATTVTAANS